MEVLNGATKLGISFARVPRRSARRHGLGTIPGTAAEILDDDVRWVLTKGKLPADTWEEIVRTAHGLGHPQLVDDHVRARRRAAALGFPHPAPRAISNATRVGSRSSSRSRSSIRTRRSTSRARLGPGPTFDENRRMHAVARILLDGVIHNVQVSWVKLGVEASQMILNGGANDFGGTLMEETISRMAGAAVGDPHGARREFVDAIRAIGRVPVERIDHVRTLAAQGCTTASEDGTGSRRVRSRRTRAPDPLNGLSVNLD